MGGQVRGQKVRDRKKQEEALFLRELNVRFSSDMRERASIRILTSFRIELRNLGLIAAEDANESQRASVKGYIRT